MSKDNKWLLMTYYCPTHGDMGIVEPLEVSRQDISKAMKENSQPKELIK